MELPLWSCFVAFTIISFIFLFNPVYTLNYIIIFDSVLLAFCGLIYGGEYLYKLNKKRKIKAGDDGKEN